MVRDLAKLEDIYNIKTIQPVDMFPWTSSVETVTILTLKNQGLQQLNKRRMLYEGIKKMYWDFYNVFNYCINNLVKKFKI